MRPNRATCLRLALGIGLAGTTFTGCGIPSTVPLPDQALRQVALVQHAVTLTLAPGQDASATASCASGEVLVSGGYATSDVLDYHSYPQVVGSYPSDSSGTSPTSSSQVEGSWTVHILNTTAATISYSVVANCLAGHTVAADGISTGVWQQPFADTSTDFTVGCPDGTALTGGGYQGVEEPSVSGFHPSSNDGSQAWVVYTDGKSSGMGFAVCAVNVTAEPHIEAYFKDNQAVKKIAAGHYQGMVSLGCPHGETLVGGGFYDEGLQPWTRDEMANGDATHWQVSFDYVGADGANDQYLAFYAAGAHTSAGFDAAAMGTCVTIPAPQGGKATILFSNYHWLLRIPADTVVVATDGSGQIKAGALSARVSQAHSQPIAASQVIDAATGGVSYAVPSGCGAPQPAIDAATNAVSAQLKQETPSSGQLAFGGPIVTTNRDSLTCAPVAGTVRTAPFTYTQAIDATATQGTYDPKVVVAYQNALLQQAAQQKGSQYTLRDTLICPDGPKLVSTTDTRATLQCAAYGVAEWPWSADQLHTLAQSLAGKTIPQAQQILDTTPGIEAHSAMIDLPPAAGGKLPAAANDIVLVLVRTQDTAPIVRAP